MRNLLKVAAWVQQNYDGCLLLNLGLFPIALYFCGPWFSSIALLLVNGMLSAILLSVKIRSERALRVPRTQRLWFFVLAIHTFALLIVFLLPRYAMPFVCVVLPIALWVTFYERRVRYQIAKQRITQRRIQQSRWRASKQQVLSSWKEKLRWIAGVQHDMRQPLHALGLLVGHPALNAASSDTTVKLVVQQITSCQRWLHDLAENLLEATRLELGEQRAIRISHINAAELCNSIETWIAQLAESKGLTLNISCEDFSIHTDVRRLKRVIGNLVFNAVEHTQEGHINIQYLHQQGMHCFNVEDSGPGLDLTWMHENTDAEHQGVVVAEQTDFLPKAGIGLYVVKRLCHEMNWTLKATSNPDAGTCFRVEFSDTTIQ